MSLSNPLIQNSGEDLPPGDAPAGTFVPLAQRPGELGKYILRREIGRGGMGVVYEGEDTLLERAVAIKWLVPQSADPLALDRLLREARWAARLNHPNVVAVYDAGEHARGVYIALELVRGRSAYEHLQEMGPFEWRAATRMIAEVCQGLAAAHAAGLIHRDIKPANILLVDASHPDKANTQSPADTIRSQPWAKLSDFGLSRSVNYTAPATAEGQVVGTPHYMSPEQIRGEQLDQRTDLYSLGATYFTLLTGRFPYERDDVIQVLFAHCSATTPDPRTINADLPSACSAIIARCLAKEPRERYSSAMELLADLNDLLLGETPIQNVNAAAMPKFETGAISQGSLARKPIWQRSLVAGSAGAVFALNGLLFLLYNWNDAVPDKTELTTAAVNRVAVVPDSPAVRPALPPEGFETERAWTDKQDGTFLAYGEMEFMRLAPDGRTLAWGVSEGEPGTGRLTLYDIKRQAVVGMFTDDGRYASFSSVAFPSERYLLLALSNRVISIDRDTNKTTKLLEHTDGSASSLDVSPDGRTLSHGVVEWDDGGRVELYGLIIDDDGPRLDKKRLANREHRRAVKCVTFSGDGKYVASAGEDGIVIIGDAQTGTTVKALSLPDEEGDWSEMGYALQFSPDSRLLAAGGRRGVILWDVSSGELRELPKKHGRGIMALAFSESGEFIASGSTDGIRIWNVQEGWQAGDKREGHEGNVITGLAFARDDSVLITSGFDRRIHFVNLGRLKRSANEE